MGLTDLDLIGFINARITPKWVAKFWSVPEKFILPDMVEEIAQVQEKLLKALDAFVIGYENEELSYFMDLGKYVTWQEPKDWSDFKKGDIDHRVPPSYLLAPGKSRFAIMVAWTFREQRQKLKRCDHCKKFFLGEKADIRTRYCPECSPRKPKTKEWRRDYQKKYYKDQKEEAKRRGREKEIERIMKSGDLTREEAKEIIEADAKICKS